MATLLMRMLKARAVKRPFCRIFNYFKEFQMPSNEQQNEQNTPSLDDKVGEVINSASWTSQVKITLQVTHELVKAFNELNEHYRKDLESFNANFDKSQALYNDFVREKSTFEASYERILATLNDKTQSFENNVAKIEVLKTEIIATQENISKMSALITEQKNEITALVNAIDMQGINAKIDEINAKKTELSAFLPQFDEKKEELKVYLSQTKSDFEQYIADFRNDLDELDFVQKSQPNTGLKDQSWLDTSTGLINIFSKNSKIRFLQSDEPSEFAKLGNGWNKEGELFIFKAGLRGNEWVNLHLNPLEFDKIDFKQMDEPSKGDEVEGKAWLKMSPLNVFYLENRSFVQIDKKLVRFTSQTEPDAATETIQLNDIWKKSDDEVYICTNYTPAVMSEDEPSTITTPASAEWTALDEVYKMAKFKRSTLPSEAEIANDDETHDANKVQMRDLVFVFDENELYYCVKRNYKGDLSMIEKEQSTYLWVKKSDFEAKARFQGLDEPSELSHYDLWFCNNGKDNTKGTMKMCVISGTGALKPLSYVKKYAHYKQELAPAVKQNEFWYKPISDELYKGVRDEWVKIVPQQAIYYSHYIEKTNEQIMQDFNLSIPSDDEEWEKIKNDKQKIYRWFSRKFIDGKYQQNPQIIDISPEGDFVLASERFANTSFERFKEAVNENHFMTILGCMSGGNLILPVILDCDFADADNFTFYDKITELSDDEIFIVAQEWGSDFEWVDCHCGVEPFLWQNELNNRVKDIEKALLPDGNFSQKMLLNELIVPKYPQQIANKAYVDNQIFLQDIKSKTTDNEFVLCDLNEGLNFILGKNLKLVIEGNNPTNSKPYSTSNTYSLKVLQKADDLATLSGQSGVIVIEKANFLNLTLNAELFNIRVPLQALKELEILSYVIYNGKIHLSRV